MHSYLCDAQTYPRCLKREFSVEGCLSTVYNPLDSPSLYHSTPLLINMTRCLEGKFGIVTGGSRGVYLSVL